MFLYLYVICNLKCNTHIMKYMSYIHFTKIERNELSILLNKGYSLRDIAFTLGRNPSSISREIKKNRVQDAYVADKANQKARTRRKAAKYQWFKIRQTPGLEECVQDNLALGWTPEEIAGRLSRENNNQTVVSAKSIYSYLTSTFGRRYRKYLTYGHKKRKSQPDKRSHKEWHKSRVFIDSRPKRINERQELYHYESDTLGHPKSSRATLSAMADRKSRYFMARKIRSLKYHIEALKELGKNVKINSITFDNGVENARYGELNVASYFCHPYSSWEKGTIENTFQRLRRFIPKKTKLEDYTQKQINEIVKRMNRTPRKCLGYATPYEVHFDKQLNLTMCCT
jgi:transposase, IS30 family